MSEWFGNLPERWEIREIRDVFEERREKVSDKDYVPLSVSKGGVVPQMIGVAKTDAGDNRKHICVGDFVINSRSDRRGSSGVSKYDGSVSLINIVLTPRSQINGDYIHYLLRSHNFIEEYYRNGRGIVADLWTTRYTEMKTIHVPLPPRAEQDQIARYLDWKVSRISKLINAKRRQIALLNEQRQAIINQTLNGGIGWKKYRLCNMADIILSGLDKKSYEGQTPVSLCNYVDVYKNDFITSKINFMKATASKIEMSRLKVHLGDVIITKDSESWDDIGVPAYVVEEIENLYCAYHLAILRPNKNVITGKFLYYCFCSQDIQVQHKIAANGITRYALGYQSIHDTVLAVPELAEQERISNELDERLEKINMIIIAIDKEVSLMSEYRTRLIADVVTGKMDVREVDVPEYDASGDAAANENVQIE